MRLSFKAEYIEPILRGEKTSTIRGRCRVRPGQRIDAICQYHKPPFAQLEVLSIERMPVAAVTESWPNVRQTYDQDHVYVIHFRRVSADTEVM